MTASIFSRRAIRLLDEVLHHHGGRERNLLAHREEHLLAHDLGRDHPLGLVGVLVLGHQGRTLGQHPFDHRDQFVDVAAFDRAHRNDLGLGHFAAALLDRGEQIGALDAVDLVDRDDARRLDLAQLGEKGAVAFA